MTLSYVYGSMTDVIRRATNRFLSTGFLALAVFVSLGGCSVSATAVRPRPNVIVKTTVGGTVAIDASGVPAGEVCSHKAGLKDFCVMGLRDSMRSGLDDLLGEFIKPNAPGPAYAATFRLVEFSHSVVGRSVQVAMKWQLQLFDRGRPIVQLARTTVGPELIVNVHAADSVINALLNAVLEQIARELDAAPWAAPAAEPAVVPIT